VSEKSIAILMVSVALTFAVLLLWLLHGVVVAMRASGGYQ
jgi:hypothetical protein